MEQSSILITHSYFLAFDPKQEKRSAPYAPMGTLLAAACLRRSGHEVRFADSMFEAEADYILPHLREAGLLVIYEDSFNYLTKMCLLNMREAACRMIALARMLAVPVIVCGSDATDHPEVYLRAGADHVILGEGEETLTALADAWAKGEPTKTIAGQAFMENGNMVRTARRPVMRDLDQLPLPAWNLLTVMPYRKSWEQRGAALSLNIATTRGCPFKCNWCAKPIYGNRYNVRSVNTVVEEIRLLQSLFDVRHFWFADDLFGLKPGWVAQFSEAVNQVGLRFRYKIQSRADLIIQPGYVEALAASGCEEVWMGAESGSQKVLDAMDKGIQVRQIHEAAALLKQHGIKCCLFLQFGYPGEEKAEIRQTLSMVRQLMPQDLGISVSYPLPGTKFYENVLASLGEKRNWKDSNDLDMMFAGAYQPDFYKRLHRYVHRRFRQWSAQEWLRRGWAAGLHKPQLALRQLL